MKIKFYIGLVFLSAGLMSCEKYLDIRRSSSESLINTAEDCRRLLDNNTIFNSGFPSDGFLSGEDFYLDSLAYFYSAGGVTAEDRSIYIWESSAIRQVANPQWEAPYNKVYNANLVLEKVEKLKEINSQDNGVLNGLRGTALFYRSYAFWQVAQLYCKPYGSTANQDPGIPMRLSADINGDSERGTIEETYSRIVQDLQEAASLLSPTSIVPTRPTKAAAYAMLARVYQSMEDYGQARENAGKALEIKSDLIDFNTLNGASGSPFLLYNPEVIFHSTISGANMLTPEARRAKFARTDSVLVASYAAGDLRKDVLLQQNPDGTSYFAGNHNPGNQTNSALFNGLAVDELYLIRAESYAREGNTAAALNDLNTLLIKRFAPASYVPVTAGSADEALSKILQERRKSLLMRGLRWTDLRRLNKDSRFAVTLNRKVGKTSTVGTLAPNDLRYSLLIPNDVILYGRLAQNQR